MNKIEMPERIQRELINYVEGIDTGAHLITFRNIPESTPLNLYLRSLLKIKEGALFDLSNLTGCSLHCSGVTVQEGLSTFDYEIHYSDIKNEYAILDTDKIIKHMQSGKMELPEIGLTAINLRKQLYILNNKGLIYVDLSKQYKLIGRQICY